MLRDLTKSMLSFSWAMSLFGAQQVTNFLTPQDPSQPTHKATVAFNAVTQATQEQFGDTLERAFKAGDQLQKGMMDLTFSLLTFEIFNPNRMMRMTSDMMQQTSAAFSPSAQGSSSGTQQEQAGWGPVPPGTTG